MSSIQWDYPWYIIVGVIGIALLFAILLYYRASHNKNWPSYGKYLLPVLRFASVALILLLILNPSLRRIENEEIKPILGVLIDNSESIGNSQDTNMIKEFISILDQSQLGDRFQVKPYYFDDDIRQMPDSLYRGQSTNLSQSLRSFYGMHKGLNVASLTILSDGIVNAGSLPVYAISDVNMPIYTIGVGDTSRQKDLSIKNVFHSDLVLLEDEFEVEVDVSAFNLVGEQSNLRLERIAPNPERLAVKSIQINRNSFFESIAMRVPTSQSGSHHFRVRVEPIAEENNQRNNYKDFYLNVIDGKINVTVVARAPHPDLSVFRRLSDSEKNIRSEIHYIADMKREDLEGSDVIVFHGLPDNSSEYEALFSETQKRKLPYAMILGPDINVPRFNEAQNIVRIKARSNKPNYVTQHLNKDFDLFNIAGFASVPWDQALPLKTVFGDYQLGADAEVLLYQRIGQVNSNYPLIAFSSRPVKHAVLLASDWWKWRMFDYTQSKSFVNFDALISGIIMNLASKEDRSPFRVFTDQNIYTNQDRIQFTAYLRNQNLEQVNEPDVAIKVTDSEDRNYEYLMDRNETGYALDIGSLPAGNYRYSAETLLGGRKLKESGRFSIQSLAREQFDTRARHDVLASLSEKTGGIMFDPKDLSSWESEMMNNLDAKPTLRANIQRSPFIDMSVFLFLIALLLFIEWILRKYWGAY